MCGFTGFCYLDKRPTAIDTTLLKAMADSIVHRGPDDEGIWVSNQHGLALANRRLSIIDTSSAGRMPMQDVDCSVVISYNGMIYNYRELRIELEALGHQFATHTDTEVIIAAYKAWGIDCLHRLDGFFAFVLFDKARDELFLVRDRMGIKPLYFSMQGGVLSFASEIKALWTLPWMKKETSSQGLYHYLTFMVTPAPYTIFEQVYKLPAGFYAKVSRSRRVTFHEWYDLLAASVDQNIVRSEQDCIQHIRDLLVESTKKRLVCDVPFGAFLSGGIDSSLNVALMAQYVRRVKTFTVSFSDGPEHDELQWARLVAQQFDTDHHEIVISEREAFEFFERMVHHLDEPLADCVCVPFFYVSKLAHDVGVKVVQVGEGADELFFGYPVYARQAKHHKAWWSVSQRLVPGAIKKAINMGSSIFLRNKPRYAELINNWASDRSLFWGGAIAFNEKQKQHIFSPARTLESHYDAVVEAVYPGIKQSFDSYDIVRYHRDRLMQVLPQADLGQEILYLELKHRLPELLLMRADKMSMATSLEAREPYLDYRLVEFMFNVPLALKFKNNSTKYLLKKAAQGILPDVIIHRKKVGFGAPTTRWFNQGKYFPAYFQRLAAGRLESAGAYFSSGAAHIEQKYAAAPAQYAVQRWVLQNFWALR